MPLSTLIHPFHPAEGPPPGRLGAFIRWALSGAWPGIWISTGISALGGVTEVMSALVMGMVVDAATGGQIATFFADNWVMLLAFAAFFLLLRPLAFGLNSAANFLTIAPNVEPLVLSRLNRFTMGQDIGFFDNDFAGRIAQKQIQTARALTEVVAESINTVAFALSSLIGSAALVGSIDWRLGLVLVIWSACYLALIRAFMPHIRKRAAARAGARAMVTGHVVDTITNIRTVKLFAHARHEDRNALNAMQGYRERVLSYGRVSASFRIALMLIAGLLPVLLVGGTLWLWTLGQTTTGAIVAAGTVAIRLAQMTGWVSFTLMGIYGNVGEVEDGMRTLSAPHALSDTQGARDLPPVKGEIRFDDVTFAYGRRTGGVDGLNLTIHPGERIGIVGASGAGKSTLVALLLRLYDTEKGAVRIDGIDVRSVTQESLRRQIGMVTQDTAMFNRSARDNIRYGRPDATDADLVAAAEAAEAHEFILDLRDSAGRIGYDAQLGERGVRLSGGQRQRIALARAFLKDAPILVLDEATSALDSEVEAQIQKALGQVMAGKTVLAIAHRLSTIARMDRIIVLDAGRIVEEGTHDALLAQGGRYARFWARQSGGFLGVDEDEVA
ncbi:MAG: ABC transporter ATP-binding protein [Rhodobacter sp.]|uniref:ABC transporter ATP-binding protein n=1 Tax=Pararhodobacter sp. TaxID=2127056 RepID=UPI001D330AB1|nr:ABC transporter ATP-binding protein [Pararhodobacter sp.]MCB1345663.1 ABC transporter ATP-binding protein [Paracoccaceae bacterium]MCC0072424.1 ABC transporter ATP-binding protein [Rhodobacter sp.]HPD92201.1 ABC transporter ATP-binding protein [Pararhodobacter sp.]